MTRKTSTFRQLSVNGIGNMNAVKTISAIILGLSLLALVVLAVATLFSTGGSGVLLGTEAGLEASTARWSALGESYAPDYEAVAAASSARYSAMGEALARSQGGTAELGRWKALGERYSPDFMTVAAVGSARYSALGDLHLSRIQAGNEASAAR